MATINSLGLGSGVLTSDVIDKLKANDTSLIITPFENKITLQKQKSEALKLLDSLLTNFKSSVSALDNDSLYQKRSVSGGNDSISVTANAGVAIQSFSISDTQLALKNVQESGKFSSTSNTIASGAGTMTLNVGGLTYDIPYTASTTLDTFKDSINSIAGERVKASTLQVGENDYRLILTSVKTGEDQTISITNGSGNLNNQFLPYNATTNPDGMAEIQAAKDASFKYNGITITRSSNEIDDVIAGVKINLLKDSGSANISVSQDTQAISDEMSNFVQNYNTLTSQLSSMTTTDVNAGKVGIFNGDNTINTITREINRLITSVNKDGLSLPQFGIDLSETGSMSFNASTFLTKFKENTVTSETFFNGKTTTDIYGNEKVENGLFTSLNTLIERYTGYNGMMTTLTTGSTDELKTLTANKARSQALLDAKYETMTARFVQYDSLITKLNNQFSSLQQQITAMLNAND